MHRLQSKYFSSSTVARANRAVVYATRGNPAEVLQALTYQTLPSPLSNSLNIRYLLSPINPADINVIEGAYPAKPTLSSHLNHTGLGSKEKPVFVAGNEGLAQVQEVGQGVKSVKVGDWVVMVKSQAGTWASAGTVSEEDVVKVPIDQKNSLSEVHAATMTVNTSTAFNVLRDFVDLKPGDWILQNGANSTVGKAVIQIAAHRGLKTINFVRDRENLDVLKKRLTCLGATHVLTYEELANKAVRQKVKELTSGANIRLALNCVAGLPTKHMAALLGQNAHLVSYGAMSKQPLELSTSLFIFKNLTCHGYWQSRWYKERGKDDREALMKDLVTMMIEGKLKEPDHEIVTISGHEDDEAATQKVRKVFENLHQGQYGKKVLLKLDDVEE